VSSSESGPTPTESGSRSGPQPGAPIGAPTIGAPALTLTVALAGALAAMAAGALAALRPELFELEVDLSPSGLASLALVLGLAVMVLRRPGWGLVLLVALLHLNLSEILVRRHELPSLLQMLSLPLLAAGLFERGRRELEVLAGQALTWLLAGWVLVQLASTALAQDPALADARVAEGAKAFGLFVLVVLLVRSRKRLRMAVWTLLGTGSLLAALGLIQEVTGNFRDEYGGLARIKDAHIYGDVFEPRIAGPLGDPNYFAQILLMLVPLALMVAWSASAHRDDDGPADRSGRVRKYLAYGAAGLMMAATVLTYSRGGALALGVVVTLAFLWRGLKAREVVAGLAVAAVLVLALPSDFLERLTTLEQVLPGGGETLHPDSSFEKRRLVTRVAWEIFLDHPVLGVGAGNYTVLYDRYADRVGSAAREYDDPGEAHYPHNLYLEIGAETGLPGLLVFGAAVLAAFAGLRRARRWAQEKGDATIAAIAAGVALGLLGYLLSSLFLHGQLQRYLWLLLALAAAIDALSRRPDDSPAAGETS